MVPSSRATFRTHCLRQLGVPVIEVNIDEDQIQDAIDDALSLYQEHHFDAVEELYLKHEITAGELANNYIDIPDPVRAVTSIFPAGSLNSNLGSSNQPFNWNYQMRLNDLETFTSTSMIDYYLYQRHIALIDEIMVGETPIRFSRHQNRLYIDTDWNLNLPAGRWIIIECYRILDPGTYSDIWADDWLKRYATALMMKQWGHNMRKFTGVKLLGGVEMNGQQIYMDAVVEVKELREELRLTWDEPPGFLIG